MQKKLVQSSLALSAAAALGLGSAFFAGPAIAADKPVIDVQSESAVQDAVAEYLANDKGELPAEIGRFGSVDDTLYLGVSKKTDSVKKFDSKFKNVEVKVSSEYTAGEPQAKKDLVGGAGYLFYVPALGGNAVCSTGFSGWDASGAPIVLTAGHCADVEGDESKIVDTERPSTAQAAGGEGFQLNGTGAPGTWGKYQYGSTITGSSVDDPDKAYDFGVIKVAEGFNVKPEVTDWSTAKDDDLSLSGTKITQLGTETPGASISKSGRTTGLTTGTVSTDTEFQYANIGGRAVHGFQVDSGSQPFSASGDSGGAVFQGDSAIGVISGGPAKNSPDFGKWSWIADLDYSLEKSGQTITFKDPNQTPEPPAAPIVSDQTIKPNGAVTGKAAPNTDVQVTWGPAPQAGDNGDDTVKTDADGNFSVEGPANPGVYDYTATAKNAGGRSETVNFKVTVEDDSAANADAGADGADSDAGADGAGANADAGADAKDANADAGADAKDATADAGADAKDSSADAGADAKDANADAAADSKDSNADADDSKDGEAPAERAIAIEPKEIAASEFVKEDKGVKITVKGFDEGEKVTLEVMAGPENVKGIELTETANADGVARFSIYGTSASNPSVYVGKYDVSVTGANDTDDESPLTGSFKVVADDQGNGGGGSDDGKDGGNGGGGSDLPRTGAELTGLAAGAGLLLVGGAAVVLTMRRVKKN